MRRLMWRVYRNLLLFGTPLITTVLVIPPLIQIIIFRQPTPFDEALQYLPPLTLPLIYFGATALAVGLFLVTVGVLLVPTALLIWQHLRWSRAIIALAYALLVSVGYSLLVHEAITHLEDAISLIHAIWIIVIVVIKSLPEPPAKPVPAAPNHPLADPHQQHG